MAVWKIKKKTDNFGISPLKRGTQLLNESTDKASILINQFRSVFTRESGPPPNLPQTYPSIPNLEITVNGVCRLLKNINIHKAVGPDSIPNIILKTCADEISPGLTHIFKISIAQGKLPQDWLNANVSPVFKKGNRHLAENYRPVSLTSVSCKILEHIICRHLLVHFDRNKILSSLNHGFRSGYSCETQLLVTIEDLMQAHDRGHQTDVVILDFSKAFDTVPHAKLLQKVHSYGVTGSIHEWLKAFLTQRQMRVACEGSYSESVPVQSGVPQGTVLGPLLFLCHINDLPDCVKSSVRLFADDCLLYRVIRSSRDCEILQGDLIALERWANDWGMKFNAKKCYVMSIAGLHRKKSQYMYNLCQHTLLNVPNNPYLGVQLSNDLKWSTHISNVNSKASAVLGFLRRNLRHCPQNCKKTAYIALVRSILEYACVIWDPYLAKDINMLENIQKKAARFILNDYTSKTPGCVTKMLKSLDLPDLQLRRAQNRITMFYKIVKGLVPAIDASVYIAESKPKRKITARKFDGYVSQNFVKRNERNNSKCYVVKKCNSEQYKNSFFCKTVCD